MSSNDPQIPEYAYHALWLQARKRGLGDCGRKDLERRVEFQKASLSSIEAELADWLSKSLSDRISLVRDNADRTVVHLETNVQQERERRETNQKILDYWTTHKLPEELSDIQRDIAHAYSGDRVQIRAWEEALQAIQSKNPELLVMERESRIRHEVSRAQTNLKDAEDELARFNALDVFLTKNGHPGLESWVRHGR